MIPLRAASEAAGLLKEGPAMRRLVGLISLFTLVAALIGGAAGTAQEASPAASSGEIPEELAAWAAAWAAADTEAILATYTADAVFEEVPIGVVTHGQDELRAHIEGLKAAFPDFSLVVSNGFVADDWAAAEWVVSGTYSGQFPGMPPGAGQSISIRGSSILALEDGKISADREYWDAYGFLVAAGALPAPEAAATPAA
jgi:steroid delta-isomerase-like uncharacterized protein